MHVAGYNWALQYALQIVFLASSVLYIVNLLFVMSKPVTPEEASNCFFHQLTDETHPKFDPDKVQYLCRCGVVRSKNNSGWSNLFSHIKDSHSDYKSVIELSRSNSCSRPLDFMINVKVKNIFGWIEWIVMGMHPFTFCALELTHKYTNLKSICYNTFMKYFRIVSEHVEKIVAKELPQRFGLVLDG